MTEQQAKEAAREALSETEIWMIEVLPYPQQDTARRSFVDIRRRGLERRIAAIIASHAPSVDVPKLPEEWEEPFDVRPMVNLNTLKDNPAFWEVFDQNGWAIADGFTEKNATALAAILNHVADLEAKK